MARDKILAIDSGTQSVRALVFDTQGRLLRKVKVAQEHRSPRPGWAEQDADYYWEKLCEATRAVLQETSPGQLAAVALTTQRNTVVPVDAEGRPLRPAIVWLDQRRATRWPKVSALWRGLFALAGMSSTLRYFQAESEANWLAEHEPEVWEQTAKFLFLSGYLLWRLTGRFVDSVGSQVGFVPFDYKRLEWAPPSDWKWQALPVTRSMLPDLVPPGQVLGEVTARAAEGTGIPEGLPVVSAAADKACEVLGAGGLTPEVACLSYGTTATVNTTHERYVEAVRFLPPYPAALPGAYNLEIQIYRGYWLVSWFKREFGYRETLRARELGVSPETLFDELVRQVPPGSMGLVLQPYWSPGVKLPGPEARGAIVGFGDVHTRAHVYRAILEGLAFALREGLERCERRVGFRAQKVRVAGGGSQSDEAMQITADVFGLPAERPHVYEASGLGAAICAAVGVGLHPGFPAAVRAMTRVGARFEPEPSRQATYEALYREVYRKLYQRLQPLYRRIQKITGYPEAW